MIKIRNFEDLTTITEQMLTYITELPSYKKDIENEIRSCEINLIDLDHILEIGTLSAPEMSKLMLTRKKILLDRRKLKDELELIDRIPTDGWHDLYRQSNGINVAYKNRLCDKKIRRYSFRENLKSYDVPMSNKIKDIINSGYINSKKSEID